jgi:hypothetical protein
MYHTIVWYICSSRILDFISNRDALLLAAKKCLWEKGYNRTTARDIASAAGVSLAAIGYHFSSKETLLTCRHGETWIPVLTLGTNALAKEGRRSRDHRSSRLGS